MVTALRVTFARIVEKQYQKIIKLCQLIDVL